MKSKTYEEFVEKFKPKKTTDDCYTPPEIYEVIKKYVCKRYGISDEQIVRPFFPGGDYKNYDYPKECIVLDNPPFSIFSEICEFYLERGISFFLFAPSLTILSSKKIWDKMNHIICDCKITYENGAVVNTSFVTNMDEDIVLESCPELTQIVSDEMKRMKKEKKENDSEIHLSIQCSNGGDGTKVCKKRSDLQSQSKGRIFCVKARLTNLQKENNIRRRFTAVREGSGREGSSREDGGREGSSNEMGTIRQRT